MAFTIIFLGTVYLTWEELPALGFSKQEKTSRDWTVCPRSDFLEELLSFLLDSRHWQKGNQVKDCWEKRQRFGLAHIHFHRPSPPAQCEKSGKDLQLSGSLLGGKKVAVWVQCFGFTWGERLPKELVSVFLSQSTDGTWQILDALGLLRTKENWMACFCFLGFLRWCYLWYRKQKPKQLGSHSFGRQKRGVEHASSVPDFWWSTTWLVFVLPDMEYWWNQHTLQAWATR